LALVSCTAAQKKIPVRGIQAAKMRLVGVVPRSGVPDDNSNTQPTAAIAAIQDPIKNTPLFGVTSIHPLFDV
jgi:hypothetical protein